MPLRKSPSDTAVSRNIRQLRRDGYPAKQSVAIALDIQRKAQRGKAGGGIVWPGVAVGYLKGGTPGRADSVSTMAEGGSYVVPADIVSGLGEGNSDAGAAIIAEMIARRAALARGGFVSQSESAEPPTPVLLSHGEYVIPKDDVARFGAGDHEKGVQWLDKWVVDQRKSLIRRLRTLKPPVKT